jgi:hypothetical protein
LSAGWRRALLALAAVVLTTTGIGAASAAAPETLVLSDLDRGADTAAPFVVGGFLVDGPLRVALPDQLDQLLGMSGDDYVLQGFDTRIDKQVVVRVSPDGTRHTIAARSSLGDARLSADGATFVASRAFLTRRTVLAQYDATTGAILARHELRGYATVLDYDGDVAVVAGSGEARTSLWDVSTDEVRRLVRQVAYEADLGADRLARLTSDDYEAGCSVVSSISRPRTTLWRSCEEGVRAFSADGSRLVTAYIVSDGPGPVHVTLRTVTGRLLGDFRAPYLFGHLGFEDADNLLLETYSRRSVAGVRCDADTCERASRVVKHGLHFRDARNAGPGG